MRTARERSLAAQIWPALVGCLVVDVACGWLVFRVLDWFGF